MDGVFQKTLHTLRTKIEVNRNICLEMFALKWSGFPTTLETDMCSLYICVPLVIWKDYQEATALLEMPPDLPIPSY